MGTRIAIGSERKGWLWSALRRDTRRPQLPEGIRVFAIGDIHGRRDLLDELLSTVEQFRKTSAAQEEYLIFLGDYIDRGPDSKGVLDLLLGVSGRPFPVFLRGNHDQTLLDFLKDPIVYRTWRNYGGGQTLLSYGVMPPRFDDPKEFAEARDKFLANCPGSHISFLENSELYYELGDYLFVHAGVRPGIAVDRQDAHDLLWIRDPFLSSDHIFDRVVVHGHSPSEAPVCRPNRLGLDTGAHATGCLTAAVLEADRIGFLRTGSEKLQYK